MCVSVYTSGVGPASASIMNRSDRRPIVNSSGRERREKNTGTNNPTDNMHYLSSLNSLQVYNYYDNFSLLTVNADFKIELLWI